jgi:hypothetical protein
MDIGWLYPANLAANSPQLVPQLSYAFLNLFRYFDTDESAKSFATCFLLCLAQAYH